MTEGGYAQADSDITTLVGRLSLDRYKATIKGLTKFGDRRQGTERNRDAVDWIEAQLKSYGCSDVERLTYDYHAAAAARRAAPERVDAAARGGGAGPTEIALGRRPLPGRARAHGRQHRFAQAARRRPSARSTRSRRTVRRSARRCTAPRSARTHPDEMYIVGGHMDGIGWGEAANDDGSGAALVMELARVFSDPDVKTDRSIRFVLWNNEETGLNGSARLRRAARGAAGQGGSRPGRASIRSRSGSA